MEGQQEVKKSILWWLFFIFIIALIVGFYYYWQNYWQNFWQAKLEKQISQPPPFLEAKVDPNLINEKLPSNLYLGSDFQLIDSKETKFADGKTWLTNVYKTNESWESLKSIYSNYFKSLDQSWIISEYSRGEDFFFSAQKGVASIVVHLKGSLVEMVLVISK